MTLKPGEGQLSTRVDGGTDLKLENMAVIARAMYEYMMMFNLESDGVIKGLLNQDGARVLDIPGSASTFAFQLRKMAERAKSNLEVISADIVYDASPEELYDVATETAWNALASLIFDGDSWKGAKEWLSKNTPFGSPSDLLYYRCVTYDDWRNDFKTGREKGFYVTDSFPKLEKFKGQKFELIVSGNCLFAYADKLFGDNPEEIFQFHVQSVLAMANLLAENGELRIYPIGTASVPEYPRLGEIIEILNQNGFSVSLDTVAEPPNVKHWDKLLRVTRTKS